MQNICSADLIDNSIVTAALAIGKSPIQAALLADPALINSLSDLFDGFRVKIDAAILGSSGKMAAPIDPKLQTAKPKRSGGPL